MNRAGPRSRVLVHGLFFLSGASALIFEVTWTAHLGRIFGTTAEAAAATLAALFLGLALGAAVFGRQAWRMARPLRIYGILEVGAALLACSVVAAPTLYGWIYGALNAHAGALTAGRFAIALVVVGPAAFLMGGTFPILGEHLARGQADLGRRASGLYALNTAGAALGTVAATFWLPAAWGWRATLAVGTGLALLVGGTAIGIGGARLPPAPPRTGTFHTPRTLLGLALASGALALALQVLWIRMFAQAFPSSIYVFGTVLVVFLVALSLGAGLAHVLARRQWPGPATLTVLLAAAALLAAATGPAFFAFTGGLAPPPPDVPWSAYVGRLVLSAAVVLGLPAVAAGTFLPWLMRMAEGDRTSGRRIDAGGALGRLAAWNLTGAVLGATLAGFVLLPALGLWNALGAVAGGYALLALLAGVGVKATGARIAAALGAVAVGASFFVPLPLVRLANDETLVHVLEGPGGVVAVIDRDGERKLVVDNVFTLGGTHDRRWEAMQAHVPLCLHPSPERVFFLGLGTGITATAALDHPVSELLVAELVPDVIEAARLDFAPWTEPLFRTGGVAEVRAEDARHHLRWTDDTYDVIVGDLFFPWEPGTTHLYTREHFRAVRARLAKGGLFAQWLPCYQLSEAEFRGIARTMTDVFEHVVLWRGDFFSDRPLLALVGYREPARLDPEGVRQRALRLEGGLGDDLAQDADTIPLHLYVGNLKAAPDLLTDARPLTDDLPWLAFTAPRSERRHQETPDELLVGERLLAFETAIQSAVPVASDPYLADLDKQARKLVAAGLDMRRMAVAMALHRRSAHARALLAYVRKVPAWIRPDLSRWIE